MLQKSKVFPTKLGVSLLLALDDKADFFGVFIFMKKCKKCEFTLDSRMFYKNTELSDGLENKCKKCRNEESSKNYKNKKEYYSKLRKIWYENNREKYLMYCQKYQQIPEVKTRRKILSRTRDNKRRKIDIKFRIKKNLRSRLWHALKGKTKSQNTMKLLGCDIDFLKKYLENKFLPGMSWKNYSYRGWHVDHIMPCDLFDLSKPKEQKRCFHYTNLQPLWAKDNISKNNKITNLS